MNVQERFGVGWPSLRGPPLCVRTRASRWWAAKTWPTLHMLSQSLSIAHRSLFLSGEWLNQFQHPFQIVPKLR